MLSNPPPGGVAANGASAASSAGVVAAWLPRHGYTGEWTDPIAAVSGLTYLRDRDYSPTHGRFLRRDSLIHGDRVWRLEGLNVSIANMNKINAMVQAKVQAIESLMTKINSLCGKKAKKK